MQRRRGRLGQEEHRESLSILLIYPTNRMFKGCLNSICLAFYSPFIPRRVRRIEDLKVQLAVVADLERSLAANGSIDAKSLEDIGRKKEYEMELKSLEDMKL